MQSREPPIRRCACHRLRGLGSDAHKRPGTYAGVPVGAGVPMRRRRSSSGESDRPLRRPRGNQGDPDVAEAGASRRVVPGRKESSTRLPRHDAVLDPPSPRLKARWPSLSATCTATLGVCGSAKKRNANAPLGCIFWIVAPALVNRRHHPSCVLLMLLEPLGHLLGNPMPGLPVRQGGRPWKS
jgi:hypothetical protein